MIPQNASNKNCDKTAEIAQLECKSAGHRKLMLLVRRNSYSALTRHNAVEIQQDAAEFYPRMMQDIQSARHSIHLQYFIWGADPFTEELKDILRAQAKTGVEVRLLYDPIGSQAHVGRAYVRDMRAAGIHMAPTSPLYRLHTISYRNHRKITVVDGLIGYTSGMNIGQEHLSGGKGFDFWRDTQVRIVGEGAALLQAVFMVDWYNAVQKNLFAKAYFPTEATASIDSDVPVQILTSGPDSQWAAIRQLYAFMIVSAQRHVFMQSPFFIPDATIAEALMSAALAGVEVKVMVSARPSGNRLPDWAGNTYIAEEGVSELWISSQTATPNSYRLLKSPITKSCMRSVFEKQIVRRTNRLIRVRKLMCLLSIFCVLAFPTWCCSASSCRA